MTRELKTVAYGGTVLKSLVYFFSLDSMHGSIGLAWELFVDLGAWSGDSGRKDHIRQLLVMKNHE